MKGKISLIIAEDGDIHNINMSSCYEAMKHCHRLHCTVLLNALCDEDADVRDAAEFK